MTDFLMFQKALTTKEKDRIAEMIGMDRAAFEAFEKSYRKFAIDDNAIGRGFFGKSAKTAALENRTKSKDEIDTLNRIDVNALVDRIVDEFVCQYQMLPAPEGLVTRQELISLPAEVRPQCTSSLMAIDINEPSSTIVLEALRAALEAKDPKSRLSHYGRFRAMLEILDLDPITYEMLGKNPNNMSRWFPTLKSAIDKQTFFKIPETKIVKVPMTMLQLSRLDYGSLNPVTLKIIDDFCMKAFQLDVSKTYFIKTGIFSSKFDFRNAKVSGEKEVRELGEYLLYITHLGCQMASPLNTPCIYGAGTTNEWVVREFIEDKENNPCIYKGLPLHTEYRCFVDFETQEILGVSPYWRPDVMKKRFDGCNDRNDPDMVHDYIVYTAHEETLMRRYNENVERVVQEMSKLICDMRLTGQWSIDVMQNGDNFYVIDMALASTSALRDVVPKEKMKVYDDMSLYLPKGEKDD